jgi:hypothetical protein
MDSLDCTGRASLGMWMEFRAIAPAEGRPPLHFIYTPEKPPSGYHKRLSGLRLASASLHLKAPA